MARTILFTGFPGFIGARLIPRLLADDPEATVVALVEPRMQDRARQLAAELDLAERVVVQPGDITKPRLGLDDAAWDRLTSEVVMVFHLAAVYDLAVPTALAERVNVVGTAFVLDFCRACTRLERHLYVSTAYVAGLRTGTVREVELDQGQDFKNHYESTKFAAELLVRGSMVQDRIPTTICRPAIVVGDSRTGETAKFDGPYYVLRSLSALSFGPLPQIGSDDAPFNVVPVDFVVDGIAVAARAPGAEGLTLHLVDPEPVSAAELVTILARELLGRRPRYPAPVGAVERSLKYGPVRSFFGGTPRESMRYLNHPVRFDVANAAEVLGGAGLRCPRFAEYAPAMTAFFQAHEDDPAFASSRTI